MPEILSAAACTDSKSCSASQAGAASCCRSYHQLVNGVVASGNAVQPGSKKVAAAGSSSGSPHFLSF